ncbi:hypothetical protein B0H21DRAFT_727507 [Amylocystis lapponica]|nr:hypothetical protein B0H21DRAFT_727507 [Amylocystis lapponica]
MFPYRDSQHPDDISEQFTSISYRRASIPHIASLPGSTNPITRRAPLTPLDPQTTHPVHIVDQMSLSSSSLAACAEAAPEREHAADLARFNIGRPIITQRTASDDSIASLQATRRKSIPTHGGALRPPLAPLRTSRRSSHASSASISSNRRPSLPSIHLQPSPPMAQHAQGTTSGPSADPYGSSNTVFLGSDDIYSNLSSFTFGAAKSSRTDYLEMVNPFSTGVSGSADLTPRPSVSGASSVTSRQRTPKMHSRHMDDGDRADDEDEEEAARQTRAKMRAMNDGTRRPSLPVSPQRSPDSPYDDDRMSAHESDASTTYGDGEGDGDFDTDVEFDFHHNSTTRASPDPEVSDTASQNTFGGDSHNYYSPRPLAEVDDRMSIEDDQSFDDDGDRQSETSVSPVVFNKVVYAPDSSESTASSPPPTRRGSLPWNIPGANPADPSSTIRDREDSLATVTGSRRMSRSLDDVLPTLVIEAPTQAISLPQSNADWRTVGATSQVQQPDPPHQIGVFAPGEGTGEEPYVGINLDYILSRSPNDGTGARHSWSSGTPSYIQLDANASQKFLASRLHDPTAGGFNAFEFPGWGLPVTGERRPSAISMSTMSGDDEFTRAVQQLDPEYHAQRQDWSFKREQADIGDSASPGIMITGSNAGKVITPGTQEIWRQSYIGRFKVDKLLLKPDDPSKPPQQRVNARHIVDPYSKGNIRGGPTAVIHKHSRAVAFSIFRKYGLLNRAQRSGSHNMSTSGSILLATKKHEDTSQLNSHGLLRDGDGLARQRAGHTSNSPHAPRSRSQSRDNQKAKKDKGKKKDSAGRRFSGLGGSIASTSASDTGTSSQTTSLGSVSSRTTADEDASAHKPYYALPSPTLPSNPVSPTIVEQPLAFSDAASSSASTATARDSSDGPSSAATYGYVPSSASSNRATAKLSKTSHASLRADLMALDDDELLPPRTSHAEAFATLDTTSIEYLRGRGDQRSVEHDSSHGVGIAERWRRRLLGQNTVKIVSRTPSGPPSAALEAHYTPPWMTMAPRTSASSIFRPNKNDRNKPRRTRKAESVVNIRERPYESLHMLLPLWAGETDPASTVEGEDASMYVLPLEERQYLLVYYVPFDDRRDKGKKKQETNKKRARGDAHGGGAAAASASKTVSLSAFRVCGRLVSYQDLLGTGVRVPIDGLSAMRLLPPASTRSANDDDYVIGTVPTAKAGWNSSRTG